MVCLCVFILLVHNCFENTDCAEFEKYSSSMLAYVTLCTGQVCQSVPKPKVIAQLKHTVPAQGMGHYGWLTVVPGAN